MDLNLKNNISIMFSKSISIRLHHQEASVIFYTLKGPTHELEIYEDKIKLIRNLWWSFFSRNTRVHTWEINQLSHFEIAIPKTFIISGKLKWQTFNGETGDFRFTTTPIMVKKIETYLQKRVLKNHEQKIKAAA